MGSSLPTISECQSAYPIHTSNDIRWGIIGCGKVSADFCEAFRAVSHGRIYACASRNRRRSVNFGKRYGVKPEQCYGSYEALLADPDVQVVYIATMHVYHKDHAMMALNAGKHVLVEKPMAMNAKEARVVVELARNRNLFLMEGLWTRCFPAVREARRILNSGVIGRVTSVFSDFGKHVAPSRRSDPRHGRGATLDMGIYPIASAEMAFTGLIPTTVAAAGVLDENTGSDLAASVSLVYGRRETASIHYTKLAATPLETRYVGTDGVLTLSPGHCPTELKLEINLPEGCGRRGWTRTRRYPLPRVMHCQKFHYKNSQGFAYEAKEVIRCIKAGSMESPEYTLDESIAVAETCDMILKELGVASLEDDRKAITAPTTPAGAYPTDLSERYAIHRKQRDRRRYRKSARSKEIKANESKEEVKNEVYKVQDDDDEIDLGVFSIAPIGPDGNEIDPRDLEVVEVSRLDHGTHTSDASETGTVDIKRDHFSPT
mmetsp:Transcript_28220/g.54866  ORF Transcript_28220/g.54866 Transcript_28220/m.54866 type:complete len:488 (-) Transcript_28220:365-1828(-)|eukprot:CAMPEP_0167787592 /NCGR_PEP_ID=MMETSP0111_2-20121227/9526_1 /TAXON_ID=91324 /ORGANISM="Lotharella globosa, Strain CCCM811" /LENGTH=487 /DNA_ID=CAMNT_0007679287 /DNA_START=119 /DNA_END=1582 /DNA_ORIENTATION=-